MAKVGYLIFHWSLFELALADAINELRLRLGHAPMAIKGNVSDRLDTWVELANAIPENSNKTTAPNIRDQALALRKARNSIVHGLMKCDAQPKKDPPGYIRCVVGGFEAPTGEVATYRMANLQHFIQGIDACRRGLINLQNFDYQI